MLKARKKITHKELKQDKLVTAYFESKNWFNNNEQGTRNFESLSLHSDLNSTFLGPCSIFILISPESSSVPYSHSS